MRSPCHKRQELSEILKDCSWDEDRGEWSWSGTAQRGKDEPSRGGLGGPVVMLPGMGRGMKTEPKGQWVDGYLWLLQPQQKLMTKMSFPVVMRC